MPLCSHFCPTLVCPVSMWAEPGMLRTHSILLPFLGTSNKPDLPSTDRQAGAGCSSELCLELDCRGPTSEPHLLSLPTRGTR